MAKTKEKKEVVQEAGRSAAPQAGVFPQGAGSSETLSFWQDAVQELIGEEFPSSEAAVDAIVSLAVRRVTTEGEDTKEISSFVREQLMNDPEILESLRTFLKIKSS